MEVKARSPFCLSLFGIKASVPEDIALTVNLSVSLHSAVNAHLHPNLERCVIEFHWNSFIFLLSSQESGVNDCFIKGMFCLKRDHLCHNSSGSSMKETEKRDKPVFCDSKVEKQFF